MLNRILIVLEKPVRVFDFPFTDEEVPIALKHIFSTLKTENCIVLDTILDSDTYKNLYYETNFIKEREY